MSHISTETKQTRTSQSLKDENPNCSIAQIREGRVFVFGWPIYNVVNSEIDYSKGKAIFYKEMDNWHSLNQAVETNDISKTVLLLPLNIACEVFKAFQEIDKENERRVEKIFL